MRDSFPWNMGHQAERFVVLEADVVAVVAYYIERKLVRKENHRMEEHATTELDLSEERLQAITGGCGQCLADLGQMGHHATLSNAYYKIAQAADARGKDATLYDKLGDGHLEAAKILERRLEDRGHLSSPKTLPTGAS